MDSPVLHVFANGIINIEYVIADTVVGVLAALAALGAIIFSYVFHELDT